MTDYLKSKQLQLFDFAWQYVHPSVKGGPMRSFDKPLYTRSRNGFIYYITVCKTTVPVYV